MRQVLIIILCMVLFVASVFFLVRMKTGNNTYTSKTSKSSIDLDQGLQNKRLNEHAIKLKQYAVKRNFRTDVCFLIDMNIHSGKKRFFVYDLKNGSILFAGLVAHGSCNSVFLLNPEFSNKQGGGCSSEGRYAISYKYNGRFGTAYKLKGLDSSNSNAFERNVVLHAYGCVPDTELFPVPICNSLGCPMVSYTFLSKLEKVIGQSKKPLLMWIF